jgi:hypothetical protein
MRQFPVVSEPSPLARDTRPRRHFASKVDRASQMLANPPTQRIVTTRAERARWLGETTLRWE